MWLCSDELNNFTILLSLIVITVIQTWSSWEGISVGMLIAVWMFFVEMVTLQALYPSSNLSFSVLKLHYYLQQLSSGYAIIWLRFWKESTKIRNNPSFTIYYICDKTDPIPKRLVSTINMFPCCGNTTVHNVFLGITKFLRVPQSIYIQFCF